MAFLLGTRDQGTMQARYYTRATPLRQTMRGWRFGNAFLSLFADGRHEPIGPNPAREFTYCNVPFQNTASIWESR